jgi:hypothetical protein
MSFRERDDSFPKIRNFDPHSRLSEFRKRFEDFTQNSNNRSNMLFDRRNNGWPLNPRHVYSMAKNADLKNRSNGGEEETIPIKVIHETSNETPIPNEDRNENSDTISSNGSSHSHKSTAQQSSSSSNSSHSNSSGSVFHSNGPQSQSNEASAEPRVHHIPIKVEPRDGSTSSGYTSEPTTNATEQPLSRSSSSSSRQSGQSCASHSNATARSPSPAKSVSSSHSNPSSDPSNSPKTRIHQIPIVVEGKDSKKSPLIDNNIPKVKTTGLGQSRTKGIKTKSGPFVTRIPVVAEPDSSSELQTSSPQSIPKEQTIKLDPLESINKILADLQKYEIEVNEFNGTQADKRYRYLDEMLTRCIIKLDNIETEGKEDVRKARKEAVLAVNKCIALLESKLKTENNANEIGSQQQTVVSEPEQMVVSTPEPVSETVISKKAKESEEEAEQMQIDQTVDNPPENVSNDNQLPVNNEQKVIGQRKETAV